MALVITMMLTGQFVASAQPGIPEERNGRDPLSKTEIERVQKGLSERPQAPGLNAQGRRFSEVLVELHPEEKGEDLRANGPRRADILYYDYTEDSAYTGVVNVRTGKVEQLQKAKGVQPLISQAEQLHALEIALADPRAGALIRKQYKELTGAELAQPSDLQIFAGVFVGDSRPDLREVRECGARRCTRLMLSTADGKALLSMPVVNLSSESVLYVNN